MGIGQGRTATCKYCKQDGFRWDANHKRLYDPRTGEPHTCDEYRQQRFNPNDDSASQNAAEIMRNRVPVITPPVITPPVPVIQPASNNGTNSLSLREIEAIAQRISGENDRIWSQRAGNSISAVEDALTAKINALDKSAKASITTILELMQKSDEENRSKREVEIKFPDGNKINVGRQHKDFPDILFYLSARKHVFMVGPAGSGKSTAAEMAAKALNLPYYVQPMGPAMTDVRFLGYQDGNGRIVRTSFREAYENGGVYCADEMDKCHAGTLTAINGAIANGHCGFPDGMVKRHKDFVMVGAANTWGHGATTKYIGATKLDGSTLNRFLKVVFDYDEAFERDLVGHDDTGIEWCAFVQKVRRIVFTHKLEVIVSPRQSLDGADLLRLGHPREKVEAVTLWNDMSEDTANLIRRNL